ncbi:hypothetical protein CLAIMM_09400 [Cladophialophora immunda]|nr:hypothetical protein CLAIMM_09400 [Cladophialophora immunda]
MDARELRATNDISPSKGRNPSPRPTCSKAIQSRQMKRRTTGRPYPLLMQPQSSSSLQRRLSERHTHRVHPKINTCPWGKVTFPSQNGRGSGYAFPIMGRRSAYSVSNAVIDLHPLYARAVDSPGLRSGSI